MSHTQGKLIAGDPSDALHPIRRVQSDTAPIGRVIADVGYSDTEEENTANARRLVAAWNACEGITTERLEDLGRPLMAHLIGCDERAARQVKEADALRAVNAKLVEALEGLVEAEESMRATYTREWGKTPEDEDHYGHEHWAGEFLLERSNEARAALAKAKELKGTE